jgi:glucose-6-phosphate 1-epimerase
MDDATLNALNARYRCEGLLIDRGQGGLPRVTINTALTECELYLHGAHLTHWRPRGLHPVLWLSETAQFQAGKAIRGGIPVCWPWFGPHPSDANAKAHGFARTSIWNIESAGIAPDGAAHVTLSLAADAATRALWPNDFDLHLEIQAGVSLSVSLTTRNTGDQDFTITEALHTYLAVGDVREAMISGYHHTSYVDQTRRHIRVTEQGDAIRFTEETDRVYQTSAPCTLLDTSMNRAISIGKSGSGSTVIWNPWPAKTARLGDIAPNAWTGFACIETANAFEAAVTLAPGQSHCISTTLSTRWLQAHPEERT